MSARSLWAAVCVASTLLGAALRIGFAWHSPDAFDEVSFLAALDGYDLLAFEPHFPGYPLAVGLARWAATLGADAPYAAASAALLPLAAWRMYRATSGGHAAGLAVGLLALSPLAVLEAARPMADSIATCLLALGLAEAWLSLGARGSGRGAGASARLVLVGLFLGASVAAKPDFVLFLVALPALWLRLRPDAPSPGSLGLALTLGAAAPLLAAGVAVAAGAGGFAPAWDEATRFLEGHLTQWGGGVQAAIPEGVAGPLRLAQAAGPLLGNLGSSAAWSQGLCLLVFGGLALRAPRPARRAALVLALPYGLWTLLGQNLEHPRHVLPLLPAMVWLSGLGLARLRARPGFTAGLVLSVLLGAASGVLSQSTRLRAHGRPADRLLGALATCDPLGFRVYAGGRGRALRWRRPTLDVRRARSLEDIRVDLDSDPCPPERIFVTSEVDGARGLPKANELGRVDLHRLVILTTR